MFVAAPVRLVQSRWAPWALLVLSVSARAVATLLGPEPFNMIDLKVYVEGAQHLTDGTLYDFLSGESRLPFTYPPFSALLFKPLSWLPWTLTRILWQLGLLASLPAIIYLTLHLLGRAGRSAVVPLRPMRGILITGAALAFWLEPVGTTVNYGQINLFLTLLILGGAVLAKERGRDVLAGAGVGLAAGIKLIPAITGLYYLLQRRFRVVAASVVVFAGSVAVMFVFIGAETTRFFTRLIFDPSRTGPVFSAINQSWRGTLYRFAGHDVSGAWILACVITLGLGGWAAWAAVRAGDQAGSLLAVQFTGLLVSPISWSHHWVWVLPLLVWGLFGPRRGARAVRVLVIAWLVATYSYLVPILVALQGTPPVVARPAWQDGAASVYVVLGMLTLLVIGLVSRARSTRVADLSYTPDLTRESGAPG